MSPCEIFGQAVNQNCEQNAYTHRQGQAPPAPPLIHRRSIQIEETGKKKQCGGDQRGRKESAEDSCHRVTTLAWATSNKISSDDRRKHANAAHNEGEDNPLKAASDVPKR